MAKNSMETEVLESNLDYLEGNGHIGKYDSKFSRKLRKIIPCKVKGNGFISAKGREFIGKARNNGKNIRNWTGEYLEFVLYKIVYALVKPFPPKKEDLARELGITKRMLFELLNTPQYLAIKKDLRKEMRDRWGADIDQMVIRRAIRYKDISAAKLFYDLQGELIQKLEVTKKDDIPEDPKERNKLIERLIKETNSPKEKVRE